MADATIKGRPTATVSGLTVKRNAGNNHARILVASWKIPGTLKDGKYATRATSLKYEWRVEVYNGKAWKWLVFSGTTGMNETSRQINLSNLNKDGVPSWVAKNRNATRADFNPNVRGRYIRNVTFRIKGHNAKGDGKWASTTRTFDFPRKPSIGAITHVEETGVVSAPITTNGGDDWRERYDTIVSVYRFDSRTDSKDVWLKDEAVTGTSATVSINSGTRFSLKVGQYVRYTFKAKARGYRESFDSKKAAEHVYTRYHVIGYPAQATYRNVSPDKKPYWVTSQEADGKVIVYISTNHNASKAPVDRVILEALVSTDAETSAEAISAHDAEWEEVGVADDATCEALVADVGELRPEVGKKTYVRVKSWHSIKEVYYVNSKPIRLEKLERQAPTAADDACEVGVMHGTSGDNVLAVIKWDKGEDDSTGTEVSWSDSPTAWRSTDQPQTFDVPDDWAEELVGDTDGWLKKAELHIANVKSNNVYVMARRFMERDSDKEYGPYSPQASLPPTAAIASSVVLNAPRAVAYGSDATFSWALSSDGAQTSWELQTAGGRHLAGGSDPYTTQVVPWEDIERLCLEASMSAGQIEGDSSVEDTDPLVFDPAPATGSAIIITCSGVDGFETIEFEAGESATREFEIEGVTASLDYDGDDTLSYDTPMGFPLDVMYHPQGSQDSFAVRVGASMGGDAVWSDYSTVSVSNKPAINLDCGQVLGAQPLSFTIETDDPATSAAVVISANGLVGSLPYGYIEQTEGDTVASGVIASPEWTSGGSLGYTAEIELAPGLEFYDGGGYTVRVQLENKLNGLLSEVAEAEFDVTWGHQAPLPGDEITVTPATVIDADGTVTRRVSIYLGPPTAASGADPVAVSDRYDVYRMVTGSPVLVATNIEFGTTIVDEFAPFGANEQSYRIACVTADGDAAWSDYFYTLPCDSLRFDFSGQYLECPYEIAIKDSFEKDFQAVRHLDGTVTGSWNDAVKRSGSLETKLLRFSDPEQVNIVKALATAAGAVLVRTPDGDCYTANVTVSNLDRSAGSPLVAVSFSAEEIDLTDEFTPTIQTDG